MKVKNKDWKYKGFNVKFEYGRWYIYSKTDTHITSVPTRDHAKSFINSFCVRV